MGREREKSRDRDKEREAMELLEAAKKAAEKAESSQEKEGGAEESRCLEALDQLKSFPVTVPFLVSTQIGKHLRPLTKHARSNIKVVATGILTEWKRIYMEQTKDDENVTLPTRAPLEAKSHNVKVVKPHKSVKVEKISEIETIKVEKTLETATVKVDKIPETEIVKVEKTVRMATSASQKVVKPTSEVGRALSPTVMNPMLKCNDELRDKIREQLYGALCKVSSEAKEDIKAQVDARDPVEVAVSVESVLFEKWGRSSGSYKAKYRSFLFNIKDAKNPDFRRKVLLGHIKPEGISNLSSDEMASAARQMENEKIKQKALFECELGGRPAATTDQFKCKRCGQRKTTYSQMQTRSADEPMTTYVTCVNCNYHWKFC